MELARQNVKFIICGGVAAVLQGVERLTLDLDLSVASESENLSKFLKVMDKLSMQPRVPLPPEVLLDSRKVKAMREEKGALVFTFLDPNNPYKQVDIFLTEEMDYDNLIDHVEIIPVQSLEVRSLSRSKLIEIKESITPPRDKDLWDIKELKRLQQDET